MKYKVGDRVRVRRDLVVDKRYGGINCLQVHKKECGKIFTIGAIEDCDYQLNNNLYWWSEKMLEEVDEMKYKVGDKVREGNKVIAKRGNKVGIAKCSPEDEFDIFTGAKLALDRLEEKCNPYCWLKYGVRYYVPDVTEDKLYTSFTYRDDPVDKKIKERGLVFKTKEEAINCAKKMLEIVK